MSDITVRSFIADWLKERGYEGLVNYDGECGCSLDDLMPCENSIAGLGDCRPAYRYECYRCRNYCDNLPIEVEDPDELCDKQHPDYAEVFATEKNWCTPDYKEEKNNEA